MTISLMTTTTITSLKAIGTRLRLQVLLRAHRHRQYHHAYPRIQHYKLLYNVYLLYSALAAPLFQLQLVPLSLRLQPAVALSLD